MLARQRHDARFEVQTNSDDPRRLLPFCLPIAPWTLADHANRLAEHANIYAVPSGGFCYCDGAICWIDSCDEYEK